MKGSSVEVCGVMERGRCEAAALLMCVRRRREAGVQQQLCGCNRVDCLIVDTGTGDRYELVYACVDPFIVTVRSNLGE